MSNRLEIVILEDNLDRRAVMRDCLVERFPQHPARFFVTAGETIAFLQNNLPQVLAIALDHDLDLISIVPRRNLDPGSGRDVADFLATKSPTCPVLIHTTNAPAAVGMRRELDESGWTTGRVIPSDGENWIRKEWLPQLRNLIVDAVGHTADVPSTTETAEPQAELWSGVAPRVTLVPASRG